MRIYYFYNTNNTHELLNVIFDVVFHQLAFEL